MKYKQAIDLQTNDRFFYEGVEVVVLDDTQVSYTDPIGQQLFRLWCRREDTGAVGWMTFGDTGVVETKGDW